MPDAQPAAAAPPPPPPPAPPAPAAAAPAPAAAAAPAAVAAAPASEEKKAPAPAEKPAAVEGKPAESAKPAVEAVKPEPVEVKLPEGAQYDPEAIGEFKKIMADDKLTPAQRAQAVIDLNHKTGQKLAEANKKAWNTHVEQLRAKDIEVLKADKDFGGTKYEATVKAAASAVQQFGGEEFSKLVKAAGLDVSPVFVRTFARIRAAIAEDDTGSRAPGATPPASDQKKIGGQTQQLAGMFAGIAGQQNKK